MNSQKPTRIVLIRHGESEANIVQNAQLRGEFSPLEPLVENRADWKHRLSHKGKRQVLEGAKELAKLYGDLRKFDGRFCSPFIRTQETAVLISQRENLTWQLDDTLVERIWGGYGLLSPEERFQESPLTAKLFTQDPFFIRVDGGESVYDTSIRFNNFYEKLCAASYNDVIIIAHKKLVQAACYVLEKRNLGWWDEWDDYYDIPNVGLVEYSRINPHNPKDIRDDFSWVRTIDLANRDKNRISDDWRDIYPNKIFTTLEMSDSVEKYPKLEDQA